MSQSAGNLNTIEMKLETEVVLSVEKGKNKKRKKRIRESCRMLGLYIALKDRICWRDLDSTPAKLLVFQHWIITPPTIGGLEMKGASFSGISESVTCSALSTHASYIRI